MYRKGRYRGNKYNSFTLKWSIYVMFIPKQVKWSNQDISKKGNGSNWLKVAQSVLYVMNINKNKKMFVCKPDPTHSNPNPFESLPNLPVLPPLGRSI